MQCFHKSWNTICSYVIKQDRETAGTQRLMSAGSVQGSKRGTGLDSRQILESCKSWREVLKHPGMFNKAERSYSSIKQLWVDLQTKDYDALPSLEERLRKYVTERGCKPYRLQELGSRRAAVEWLCKNLGTNRKLRELQLFVESPPASGKTYFLHGLREFLETYTVPQRRNDFSGCETGSDLYR